MAAGRIDTTCCIAGGGPAGMVLGLLLARAGINVVVLEKHADFLRDFRGDTIHPSTLQVMHELGLLDGLLSLPHQKAYELAAIVGGQRIPVADFRHLPVRCPYIAFMPQWDFLDFLARAAQRFAGFSLGMEAEVTGLLQEGDRVVGVRADTPEGEVEVYADLVVGADGRSLDGARGGGVAGRDARGADGRAVVPPAARAGGPGGGGRRVRGRRDPGADRPRRPLAVRLSSLPRAASTRLRAGGLGWFRGRIAALAPFLAGRMGEVTDWDDVRLLTVAVDRLRTWSAPGLLCIGDAAHAMSPIGGVGINLAIQDAVAAANLLHGPLRARKLTEAHLEAVQRRRAWPAHATQRLQVLVQNRIIAPALQRGAAPHPPLPLRLLARLPWLRRLPARLIGLGLRPEHVAPPLRAPLARPAVPRL